MSKLPVTLMGIASGLLKAPERVPFGSLQVAPERFQVRNPKACNYVQSVIKEQQSHGLVSSLIDVLLDSAEVDPIVVWKGPEGTLWVIDGHHRWDALSEGGTAAIAKVWVQLFQGATEAEARHFALEINKRDHLNMDRNEVIDTYWRLLLSGEATGSVRGRVKKYGVSKSTVQRMDAKAPEVLEQLQHMARSAGVPCDVSYIRANAPTWKSLSDWRDTAPAAEPQDLNRRTVEKILKVLTVRLADDAKADLEAVIRAFEEFVAGSTGKFISVTQHMTDDRSPEF